MGSIVASPARAEATRHEIIDAAVELVDTVGYGDTGLADVMTRADITKGAFYYHFTSKDAVATDSPRPRQPDAATFTLAHMHIHDPAPGWATSSVNRCPRSPIPERRSTRAGRQRSSA